MTIEAMKQALEALKECNSYLGSPDLDEPIATLRQAIEQAEKQEPITYDKTEMNCFVQELYDRKMQEGKHGHYETMFHCVHQAIKRLYTTTQLQQDEKSEPLDKVYICNSCGHAYQIKPPSQCDCLGDEKYTEGYIYTTPQPQREWVGLTQAERHDIREWQKIQEELGPVWSPMMLYLYEAIEAKLKQKNGYAEEKNT